MVGIQSSYDDFTVKMRGIGDRLRSIRLRYAIPLNRGDHKERGAPISDACGALYAVGGDWKQARFSAQEVASAQAAVGRAAKWEVDFYQRQLREAQTKQADAQKRLADRAGIALALVQGATRVAQGEVQKEQAVTIRK